MKFCKEGKVVMKIAKEDITKAVSSLQLCAGQDKGSEASIHAMDSIFEANETEPLVDADNAFNSTSWKIQLHDVEYLCPATSTYLYNCYIISIRLFIIGGREIQSQEEIAKGDPTGKAAYALGLTPLLDKLQTIKQNFKHVVFADDLTGQGN